MEQINVKYSLLNSGYTTQKMKFSIKDFFSKSEQIRRKLVNNTAFVQYF